MLKRCGSAPSSPFKIPGHSDPFLSDLFATANCRTNPERMQHPPHPNERIFVRQRSHPNGRIFESFAGSSSCRVLAVQCVVVSWSPPHWGTVEPVLLLIWVKEQCHHFHPNFLRTYLDIFGEGMEKDSGQGLHIKWNALAQSWMFSFSS